MKRRLLLTCGLLVFSTFAFAPHAWADEGMWLFNQPPRELLKKKYKFDLSDEWLQRAQKASIRFNNGGSGSFVSAHGLVVTNHHIGAGTLQKLSTKKNNLYRDGFYAPSLKDELKCPDLELNVLESIEDVTARIQSAVKPGMTPAQAAAAGKAEIARIEKSSRKKTGLRSNVIKLYQGGMYHLYRFKKYTDIRLVFAPEKDIAFFGGDTDNFEYPRYNLDVCFFRVYENGRPLKCKHFFPWSTTGVKPGDLVFVSGNPGSTNRLETLARLKHRRDVTLPYYLNRLRHLEGLLGQYAAKSPEHARIAARDLYRVANARKAYTGQYYSLLDPAIIRQKAQAETGFRNKVFEEPKRRKIYGPAWKTIAQAQKKLTAFEHEYYLLEGGHAFYCRYFLIARHLVRMAAELAKQNERRLPEYRDSSLDSLRFQLFSTAPISRDLERAKLAGTLAFMAEILGGEHPHVKQVLAGKSPVERAAQLTQSTKLDDVAFRKKLAASGQTGIGKSTDPMIRFAAAIDAAARKLRKRYETQVQAPEERAYALISKARFQLYGTRIPPDATFSLRLAFGVVKGYRLGGKDIPFTTRFRGLYRRAEKQLHRDPFKLPTSWIKCKDKLDLNTPFNFVATSDTIGGNSGSPVLNRKGELVGINFDRNRHGLVRNYVYTDRQARHVSVHGLAVLEALRKIYGGDRLLQELLER